MINLNSLPKTKDLYGNIWVLLYGSFIGYNRNCKSTISFKAGG